MRLPLLCSTALFIMTLLADANSTRYYHNRCFSCMSTFVEEHWPLLSSIYRRPKSFSDYCDDAFNRVGINWHTCDTICLKLTFTVSFFGVPAKRIYIRGCASGITHGGVTPWALYHLSHRHECARMPMNKLFHGVNLTNAVTSLPFDACSCYGDKCNRATPHHVGGRTLLWQWGLSALVLLYSSWIGWQR